MLISGGIALLGATFTLSNAPIAMRLGAINDLAAKCNTEVIPADATSMEDLENLANLIEEQGNEFLQRTETLMKEAQYPTNPPVDAL